MRLVMIIIDKMGTVALLNVQLKSDMAAEEDQTPQEILVLSIVNLNKSFITVHSLW